MESVRPWMEFYFAAMGELKTEAVNGVIPWTAIRLYGETYGLDVEEFDDLVRFIRAMEKGIKGEADKETKTASPSREEDGEDEDKSDSSTTSRKSLKDAQKA